MKWFYLYALLLITVPSLSQATKTIIEKTGQKFYKKKTIYSVLKDNPYIKHGPYTCYSNNKLASSGYYKMNKKDSIWIVYDRNGQVLSKRTYAENVRTGKWEFFGVTGQLEWQYDFVTKQQTQPGMYIMLHMYQTPEGKWTKDKTDVAPLWLTSPLEWTSFLNYNFRYPPEALDNGWQGTVTVEITVDENGNAIDYTIAQSIHPALDQEALRIIALFEPEFIPAVKDGKNVGAKVRIPLTFHMR